MLKKLAETALWLDNQGLFKEADIVTAVMKRCAKNDMFELDDEEEEPEVEPYEASMMHQNKDFDMNNPEHMAILQQHAPAFHQYLNDTMGAAKGGKPSSKTWAGRNINFPPGVVSKVPVKDYRKFFLTDEQAAANAAAFQRVFNQATHHGKRRSTLDLNYGSTNSPGVARTMVYDPSLEALVPKTEADDGYSHLFDLSSLRSMYDPSYEEADADLREKAKLDPDMATSLARARRRISPDSVLGVDIKRREIDPVTQRKKPNYYFRGK